VTPRQLADVARIRADLASGDAQRARKVARISRREAAAVLGVSIGAIRYWELGERTPDAEHALAYGRLLDKLAA
jgi:transcriptional regulator with XRE-family HTH domain